MVLMPKPTRLPSSTFKRPVVWVLGASKGIGREIALQFSSLGCSVALSARSRPALRSLAKEISLVGGRAFVHPCDLTDARQISLTARNVIRELGSIDVLVNSAGTTVFKAFVKTTRLEFTDIITTNLSGPAAAIKAVLPHMMKRREGWIFNVLSTAALFTFKDSAAYSASKAGLRALINVVREELRPYNIKVTNVYPGATHTEMWPKSVRAKHKKRMMPARSVAEAIVALYQMPLDIVVEDLVLRPIQGDLS